LIGNDRQTPNQLFRGDDIMKRKTYFALLAAFLGASLIASGAVNRADVTQVSGVQTYLSEIAETHMASMQSEAGAGVSSAAVTQAAALPPAVPYFPAQYQLNAASGSSEPISTF
jgi:hypothetical protein